jgi:biotin transport system substrate-specific component
MHKELVTIPSFVVSKTAGSSLAKNALLALGASLFIAICAQIAVLLPLSPVPMTLQPLAILLVGAALGARRGAAATSLYLLEGAMGLPVFAQAKAGAFWLVAGPTAGYLLAFPVAAFVIGWFAERGWVRTVYGTVLAMALAIAVIHLGGWSWLAAVTGLGAHQAFLAGTAPFLVGDLFKIAVAAIVLPTTQALLKRSLDS